MLCGPCSWSGLVRVFLISLGDHLENFEVEECFQRECLGETLSGKETKGVFIFLTKSVRSQQSVRSWWGFLDRSFNRGDYEATSRLLHNSNPYWTWHVCPNGLFSTQSYTSSLRPVPHMLAFGKEDAEQEQTSTKVICKIRIRPLWEKKIISSLG